MTPINNKLKELRLKQGMLQSEVAIALNLQCENRICRWEKGESMPSVQNLFNLAKVYKVLPHIIYPDLFLTERKNVHAENIDLHIRHTD